MHLNSVFTAWPIERRHLNLHREKKRKNDLTFLQCSLKNGTLNNDSWVDVPSVFPQYLPWVSLKDVPYGVARVDSLNTLSSHTLAQCPGKEVTKRQLWTACWQTTTVKLGIISSQLSGRPSWSEAGLRKTLQFSVHQTPYDILRGPMSLFIWDIIKHCKAQGLCLVA